MPLQPDADDVVVPRGGTAERPATIAGVDAQLVAGPDTLASAVTSVVGDGPAAGCRAVDMRVVGGLDVRVLPDRGLDVGAAWYRGTPIAWRSAVGESRPVDGVLTGREWLARFGGGLVVTCGLRNVGPPSEGHGMHGAFSHQRAEHVGVGREIAGDGTVTLSCHGTVHDAEPFGSVLRVDRRVTTRTGAGLLELVDVTTNLGATSEPAPVLYHVNVGAPHWSPGSRVEVTGRRSMPRDDESAAGDWRCAPLPAAGAAEWVFEHELTPDGDGWAHARVVGATTGLTVTVSWLADSLPRLWQWVHRAAGVYSLGIEPANCSVLGRAADRAEGRLPVLEPGEVRTTRLHVSVEETT